MTLGLPHLTDSSANALESMANQSQAANSNNNSSSNSAVNKATDNSTQNGQLPPELQAGIDASNQAASSASGTLLEASTNGASIGPPAASAGPVGVISTVTAPTTTSPVSFGLSGSASIPMSSASISYNSATNTVTGTVSATPSLGYSAVFGPTVTYTTPNTNATFVTVGATVMLVPLPIAARWSVGLTIIPVLGILVPWPSTTTLQAGPGAGISATLQAGPSPSASLPVFSVGYNFNTGSWSRTFFNQPVPGQSPPNP
jgi:hypothetical protein